MVELPDADRIEVLVLDVHVAQREVTGVEIQRPVHNELVRRVRLGVRRDRGRPLGELLRAAETER